MTPKNINKLKSSQIVKGRLAKWFAQSAFRNTYLEELHSGISPSSKTGDYSDVKVVTPYGEIKWNELSRFGDLDMQKLMVEVVENTYLNFFNLFNSVWGDRVIEALEIQDILPYWFNPPHQEDERSKDFCKKHCEFCKKIKELEKFKRSLRIKK